MSDDQAVNGMNRRKLLAAVDEVYGLGPSREQQINGVAQILTICPNIGDLLEEELNVNMNHLMTPRDRDRRQLLRTLVTALKGYA